MLKDLAQALQPLMIRGAIDSFRGGAVFVRFAAYLVGLALLKGIFQYWMRVIIIGISRDIEYDLRNDLFAHLVRLSPDYYGRTRTGDIMARATNDLNAVRMMLGPGIMYWTETSLTFLLAIVIMLSTGLAPGAAGDSAGARCQPRRHRSSAATFTSASSASRPCSPISPAACRRTSPACA